jgi:hypothetical protein
MLIIIVDASLYFDSLLISCDPQTGLLRKRSQSRPNTSGFLQLIKAKRVFLVLCFLTPESMTPLVHYSIIPVFP